MSVVPHHGGMKQNIQETYAPFAIFRPGTHQPMRGKAQTFSAADIEQMAQNYNPKVHEAPLVRVYSESRALAEVLVERYGEGKDNRQGPLLLELTHAALLRMMISGDWEKKAEDPGVMALFARTLRDLASAGKSDTDAP